MKVQIYINIKRRRKKIGTHEGLGIEKIEKGKM
jgi:hypothetical protein